MDFSEDTRRNVRHALLDVRDLWLFPLLPKFNYFWCHVGYFALLSLLGGLILWVQEPISFLNGLFVAASALCVTGLSTVDFSLFHIRSQVMVMLWIKLGGLILVSLVPPSIRLLRLIRHGKKMKELSAENRMEIRILTILILTIVAYMLVVEIGAFVTIGSYLEANHDAGRIVSDNDTRNYGKWYWSIFYVITSFQNAGFGLFGNSFIPFADDNLITLTLVVVMNCGYSLWPAFLRMILWCESKVFRGKNKRAIEELLTGSRRYYYLLFPLKETLYMFVGYLIVTLIEYEIFFVEWNQAEVYAEDYPPGKKLMINFFQVIAVRHCGLNNVNIGALEIGHLALLILTMYLSAFPFIVAVRTTRDRAPSREGSIKLQTKRLLAKEIFLLYVAVIIIALIEIGSDSIDPAFVPNAYLAIVFEVSSAFGTVGLSVGAPGQNYSYSGMLHPVSRFIIILVFFCGRHRGLPDSIDDAVSISREDAEETTAPETEGEVHGHST